MSVNGVAKMANITIKNANVNNLKNLSLEFAQNKLNVLIGPSGSGKSTIAYDVIYKSSMVEMMDMFPVSKNILLGNGETEVTGLTPVVCLAQSNHNVNPRSTIGTYLSISSYLRAIFCLIVNMQQHTNLKEKDFSFNNPASCCLECEGIGQSYIIDNSSVLNEEKTIAEGAIILYSGSSKSQAVQIILKVCEIKGIDVNTKFKELPDEQKQFLLYFDKGIEFECRYKHNNKYRKAKINFLGAFKYLERELLDIKKPSVFMSIKKFLKIGQCKSCAGLRLNKNILEYKVGNLNYGELENLSFKELSQWLHNIKEDNCYEILRPLVYKVIQCVDKIIEMNMGYLSVSRGFNSISFGESQRLRMIRHLLGGLSGLTYILDEPCKGLSNCDIKYIKSACSALVNKGNTIIAIEHNLDFVLSADTVTAIGPVGGPAGGYVVDKSKYLQQFSYEKKPSKVFAKFYQINNITKNNLVNQSCQFPLNAITCITGVSGSGKTTLVNSVIEKKQNDSEKVLVIDQKAIGMNSRSLVISYLGIYDNIRKLYADEKNTGIKGFKDADFSVNIPSYRCEKCQGTGIETIDLSYLPSIETICSECEGRRFKRKILDCKYKNLSIDQLLDSTISQACKMFSDKKFTRVLEMAERLGIGYVKLGQMTKTLSGGEAQRLKLAKSIQASSKDIVYFLDEPTCGLANNDIYELCKVLDDLKSNNTFIIIEHNLDFIKSITDYLIDMGNKSGNDARGITFMGELNNIPNNPDISFVVNNF